MVSVRVAGRGESLFIGYRGCSYCETQIGQNPCGQCRQVAAIIGKTITDSPLFAECEGAAVRCCSRMVKAIVCITG